MRRGTCAVWGGKSFAAGEHGVCWGHVARSGRLLGHRRDVRTEKRTQVREALPWGGRSRTQGRGGVVCRCPEMGEDVAPSEAGRFSQEHATAVVRAVGEAARGWPGSGWRRHREGGQTADKCGEGAMRLALWHHHWLRWVEGPGGGWDLPQGDQLRDGHSSG